MQRGFVRTNCLVIGLVLAFSHFAPAQNKELTADETIPIPKVEFDAQGELKITPSPNSSPNDFDFLVGKWKMRNRHLDKRLANCRDWTEFDSSDVNTKILNGAADMDTYSTKQFPGMGGKPFEGLTLRLFDPKTRLWSLYWIASNTGKIEPPVVGSFDQNGVGHFFGKDTLNGKPIIVVFRWDARNKERPLWGQAFSSDNGKTWEWNFFASFVLTTQASNKSMIPTKPMFDVRGLMFDLASGNMSRLISISLGRSMNATAILPLLLFVLIAAALAFKRRARQDMPIGLRMIMRGCFIGVLFIPLAFIPAGRHWINGEEISFADFWLRGAGLLLVIVGVLLPVIGYGVATRKDWSRYVFAAFLGLTSVFSFAVQPKWDNAFGFLFIPLIIWYLFSRRPVRDYFATDAH